MNLEKSGMNLNKNNIPTAADFDPLIALYNARRYVELENQVSALLVNYPHAPFAWQLLGGALQMQGKDASAAFQKVAALSPNDAGAYFNLGVAYKSAGKLEQAVESYRSALVINPNYVEALGNLGNVLQDMTQLDEAIRCYKKALAIRPNAVGTQNSLGTALKDLGQLEDAITCYHLAIQLKPDYADPYYNLGNAFRDARQLEQAAQAYRQVVKLNPNFAGAHCNLGSVLKELGQENEALKCYQHAIAADPLFAEAHSNLGSMLQEFGRVDEALLSFQKASEIKADSLQFAIQASLLLPIIPASVDQINYWRKHFQSGLEFLTSSDRVFESPFEQLNGNSFYLAYHNSCNRPLMEALRHFYRERVPDLTFVAPHLTSWSSLNKREKIKVGFISEFLTDHTIGKHYKGFIAHLDRSRFEVVLIHAPKAKQDAFRKSLDALADKILTLPVKLKNQQEIVASEQLDVLFYPDIGMSSATYFLAYARLAPVQVTSWGHPDTTGLDTMDYYLSSVTNEAENAQDFYTERLIRLNRLPCFYYKTPAGTIPQLTKSELGLPTSGTLYGCPQNIFKIHPDFDAVLAEIAQGDTSGYIVIPEGKYADWVKILKERWAKTNPVLLERVVFMPRMSWNRFMAMMSQMDVLLDPLHFGSGNTFYDAMVQGTPVVTWPGTFGRGRNVAAAYQQMRITDAPVAARLEDYASIALALGRDSLRRESLRKVLLTSAEQYLFEDIQSVRELETFLEGAVIAAAKGERLMEGWRACSSK